MTADGEPSRRTFLGAAAAVAGLASVPIGAADGENDDDEIDSEAIRREVFGQSNGTDNVANFPTDGRVFGAALTSHLSLDLHDARGSIVVHDWWGDLGLGIDVQEDDVSIETTVPLDVEETRALIDLLEAGLVVAVDDRDELEAYQDHRGGYYTAADGELLDDDDLSRMRMMIEDGFGSTVEVTDADREVIARTLELFAQSVWEGPPTPAPLAGMWWVSDREVNR